MELCVHELCFSRVSACRDPVTCNERKGRQPVQGEEADQRSCGSGEQAGGSAGEWWHGTTPEEIQRCTLYILLLLGIHPKLTDQLFKYNCHVRFGAKKNT